MWTLLRVSAFHFVSRATHRHLWILCPFLEDMLLGLPVSSRLRSDSHLLPFASICGPSEFWRRLHWNSCQWSILCKQRDFLEHLYCLPKKKNSSLPHQVSLTLLSSTSGSMPLFGLIPLSGHAYDIIPGIPLISYHLIISFSMPPHCESLEFSLNHLSFTPAGNSQRLTFLMYLTIWVRAESYFSQTLF